MTLALPTVKATLTPVTPTPKVENKVFAGFVRRIIRAFGRRVGNGDVDALPDLLAARDAIDAAIGDAVVSLRLHGYSLSEIAARLGVSKQAVSQRWGGDR